MDFAESAAVRSVYRKNVSLSASESEHPATDVVQFAPEAERSVRRYKASLNRFVSIHHGFSNLFLFSVIYMFFSTRARQAPIENASTSEHHHEGHGHVVFRAFNPPILNQETATTLEVEHPSSGASPRLRLPLFSGTPFQHGRRNNSSQDSNRRSTPSKHQQRT